MLVIVGGFSLDLSAFSPVKRAFADFSAIDIYYAIRSGSPASREVCQQIVLVDIHEQRKRSDLAQTIERVAACHPRVMVLDVIFPYPSEDLTGDLMLQEALMETPTKIVASRLDQYDEAEERFLEMQTSFFSGMPNCWQGYCNTSNPLTGTNRHYTHMQLLRDSVVFSLPYLASCLYRGNQPQAEKSIGLQRIIEFDPVAFLTIRYDELSTHAEFLRDKIVIIGSKNELADMHFTPIGRIAGMEVLAYSIHTCLKQHQVLEMGTATSLLLTFLLSWLGVILAFKIDRRWPDDAQYVQPLLFFALSLLLVAVGFFIFVGLGYYIPLLYPLLALALTDNAISLYQWIKKKAGRWLRHIPGKSAILLFLLLCSATSEAQEYVVYSIAGTAGVLKDGRQEAIKSGTKLTNRDLLSIDKESAVVVIDKDNSKMYSLTKEGQERLETLIGESKPTAKNLTRQFCRYMLSQIVKFQPQESEAGHTHMSGAMAVYRANGEDLSLYNRIMQLDVHADTTGLSCEHKLLQPDNVVTTDFDVTFAVINVDDSLAYLRVSNQSRQMVYVNVLHINQEGGKRLLLPVDKGNTCLNTAVPASTTVGFTSEKFSLSKVAGGLLLLVAVEKPLDFNALLQPFAPDGETTMRLGLQRLLIKE